MAWSLMGSQEYPAGSQEQSLSGLLSRGEMAVGQTCVPVRVLNGERSFASPLHPEQTFPSGGLPRVSLAVSQ